MATNHEISHGRNITWTLRAMQAPTHFREAWISSSWIVEVMATGSRDSELFSATRFFLTSLHAKPAALPQLVRDRHEPATQRRLPISAYIPAAIRHDIKAMLALGGLSAGTA